MIAPNWAGRHAYGTHALRRSYERTGVHDLTAVQSTMGHTDPKTTQTYIDRDVIDDSKVRRLRSE